MVEGDNFRAFETGAVGVYYGLGKFPDSRGFAPVEEIVKRLSVRPFAFGSWKRVEYKSFDPLENGRGRGQDRRGRHNRPRFCWRLEPKAEGVSVEEDATLEVDQGALDLQGRRRSLK